MSRIPISLKREIAAAIMAASAVANPAGSLSRTGTISTRANRVTNWVGKTKAARSLQLASTSKPNPSNIDYLKY